jgi:5-methylcytosine-specific restriction endonuclease McrA
MPTGLKGGRWRRLCQLVRDTYGLVCWICWRDIDASLPANHRMSFTVDHLLPRALGGRRYDIANCRPAHRACNSAKGARLTSRPARMSIDW